jgi:hypothetical protein
MREDADERFIRVLIFGPEKPGQQNRRMETTSVRETIGPIPSGLRCTGEPDTHPPQCHSEGGAAPSFPQPVKPGADRRIFTLGSRFVPAHGVPGVARAGSE